MLTVDIDLAGRGYPVIIGSGLLARTDLWGRFMAPGKSLVVSNDVVAPLYLSRLLGGIAREDCHTLVLPDGEDHKTIGSWSRIIDELVTIKAGRDACVIALGGGVIGDICGFAAASYMRGIDFLQVPTTLLAQVDASVGGKTGVNHAAGKNLIGAFHQPRVVLADTDTLETLPEREYRAGLAEVVKYGAIRDPAFFAWLEERVTQLLERDRATLGEVIDRSVRNKAEVVAEDEREAGIRAILNFGHSFGHALETLTAYRRFLHGEAVAIGMVVATTLSEARGVCPPGAAARLRDLLSSLHLPVVVPADIPAAEIVDCLALDKKSMGGKVRLVLLNDLGSAFIDDQSPQVEIQSVLESCVT